MFSFFDAMDSKRRLRLRVTLLAGIEYVATCAFLAVYWRLGKADGWMVIGFLTYSLVANSLILGAIASGWSERLRDPSMTAIQMTVSCARDLFGCFFMPGLWFIFAFNLFIALPFGSLQFSNRAFAWFWLLTCAGLGAVFLHYPDRLEIGFDSREEKLLLWLFISAALARLMLFNSRISSLRRKLRSKAGELDQASRRLERERIARDLHDTLLQSIYGVVWRVAALAEQISNDDPIRGKFDAVLDRADQALAEGRDAVSGLRQVDIGDETLVDALRQAGNMLANESGISFSLRVIDDEVTLKKDARSNLEKILREALQNAFHHSEGHKVSLEMEFAEREFAARVSDDGQGLSATARNGVSGHFGLPIMSERAASIGATLAIAESPEGGALVTVRLAAQRAYHRPRPPGRHWLRLVWARPRDVKKVPADKGARAIPP
jgi:signal transduction histidine kinase